MKAGIAPGLDLSDGYVVQFTALNPTTGAVNSTVVVSNVSLLVDNLGGGDLSTDVFDATPLFIPIPAGVAG
ncbi:MAG TPA: hypothetical protein VH279_07275 [Solirubrobacteraceae bacterium]|nr:hypothetical protein [Solirubrobacteraceae bacterium]